MRSRGWLRAASVFLWIFCLGHTAGMLMGKSSGPQEDAVVRAMKDFHFDAMGRDRTLWNFWEGFNVFTSLALATLAVLVWQLGRVSRTAPGTTRPLVATLFVGTAAIAVLCWIDFFIAPAAASTLAAASLLVVWVSLGREKGT
jgi:anti-sigma-K factor RskA